MINEIKSSLRSFESKILFFHGMYNLPVAPYPTWDAAIAWQKLQPPTEQVSFTKKMLTVERLQAFKKILQDELNEVDDIITALQTDEYQEMEFLTDMADWLGDIQIYCASEMARLGIPIEETLSIIMQSNFSKLDAFGQPIISEGKVQKGPHYWKPEPLIRVTLETLRAEGEKNGTLGTS